MKKVDCRICGKKNLSKDVIGINKKLIDKKIKNYYCIDCLAEYLDVSVDDLIDRIEEFKEEGCVEF